MKKALKWLFMLNKRLYKKVTFVIILALLLLSVVVFVAASRSESGFVHIVLAQTNKKDNISSEIVKELLNEDSLAQFTLAETPEAAINEVKTGKADSAWIFPENMGSVSNFTLHKDEVIQIVEREQNVFSRLSREKLNALIFEYSARAFFISYADTKLPTLSPFSDEELLSYFENAKIDEDLFVFEKPISGSENNVGSDYLSTPLRGLLAVIVVIGGIAGLLYYMNDDEKRQFSNISQRGKSFIAFGCVFSATLNLSVVSFLALVTSGLYNFTLFEAVSSVTFAVCCASFLMVLKEIFTKLKVFCAVIPAIITIICAVCPVFFNLKSLRLYSLLFPPTYYINCAGNVWYLFNMIIYSIFCFFIAFLMRKIKELCK